jgi:outer membrane protein TolC
MPAAPSPEIEDADPATLETAADAIAEVPYFSALIPSELDLGDAQRIAIESNPDLKAAYARVQQAEERVKQARSLYFPTVGLTVDAFHTKLSENELDEARDAVVEQSFLGLRSQFLGTLFGGAAPTFPSVALQAAQSGVSAVMARSAIDESIDSYQASVFASWTIFDGFNRKFTNAIARFGALESEAAFAEAQRLLLDAVAFAYHQVQLARENVEIARADEAFNERQLKEAEARYRIGTGSLSDQLNFEVRVRAARGAVLTAERDFATARIGLAALMGIPEATLPDTVVIAELYSERPEELVVPETEPMVAYAMEFRPDLNQSRYAEQRADAAVGQARAPFFPQVRAIASRDAARTNSGRFDIDGDFSTTVGISVDYEIFAGGRNRAALREAKYAAEEAEYRTDSLGIDVVSDVRTAIQNLATAQQQLILQRATAEFVSRNRELVEKEYDAGQGSLVRLNEAQRDLIEAQSRLALARVALRQAWHDLRTATGETLIVNSL